jgi:diguanylate cyclase (GGDEF)-like protein/PAS domain S-box-containing protein
MAHETPDDRLKRAEHELARTRQLLDDAQQLARLGSWEWNLDDDKVTWSAELFRLLGHDPETTEPTGELTRLAIHPEDRGRIRRLFADAMTTHEPIAERTRMVRPDGSEWVARTRAVVIAEPGGGPARLVGTVEDVSDQVRARDSEAMLAQIVRCANDAIYTLDTEGRVTSWNPAAEQLYGYSADEMLGRTLDRLFPTEADPATADRRDAARRRLLVDGVAPEEFEDRRRCKDGELIDVAIVMASLRDSEGRIIGAVANVRDITERRRVEAKLEHSVSHDGLTGLFNRRRFVEELAAASARAERDQTQAAVLILDLDNFKYVNEHFGHSAGDALLTGIATTLQRRLRDTDVIARLGGDEFGILVAPTTAAHVTVLAGDLLRAIRRHVLTADGHAVRTSASIGVTVFGDREVTPEDLLAGADRAMYESKEAGRDRVTLHSAEQREKSQARIRFSGEYVIRDALENNRFELFTQPIADLADGRLVACEILLRLRREGRLIPPGEFLPAAERLGLIHAIDHWVIEQAIAAAAQHPDIRFQINLSGATIDDERLDGFIAERLFEHRADPANVVFELTETAAIANMARARELARSVAELGCSFAIDDFGAGFSTFYYLKHFPAKYLKIDGEFITHPRSRTDELVIESIVRIARHLGKQTVAEFVSDAGTLERVRELGVDLGQGFHISRPFPLSQLGAAPRNLVRLKPERQLSMK